MFLTETHYLKRNGSAHQEADRICEITRKLYNRAIKVIRSHYHINKSYKTDKWPIYNQPSLYRALSADPAFRVQGVNSNMMKHVLFQVNRVYVSFFQAIRAWKKNSSSFTGYPKLPKYLNKRNIAIYPIGAFSFKKKGYIRLSKTNIYIKSNRLKSEVREIRLVPMATGYKVEIVYEAQTQTISKPTKYCGIDLGINNLAVLSSDDLGVKPVLITGGPLKSMSHYYNKVRKKLRSELPAGKSSSHRLRALDKKRYNKMMNYLHTSSRKIINWCQANDITNIVIGHNVGWKNGMNMGRKNNQTFGGIAHSKFISQITYKAALVGIHVMTNEESYTSKCSFLDMEEIRKHDTYMGSRRKRGLFISSTGLSINADLNGSLNILRKVIGDGKFSLPIKDYAINPVRV